MEFQTAEGRSSGLPIARERRNGRPRPDIAVRSQKLGCFSANLAANVRDLNMLSENDIRWMVQEIVEACRPIQIYIFGSYALGTAHARSDLDFLIVQESRFPGYQRSAGIRGRLARIAIDVDLVFVTPDELRDELNRGSSIVSAIWPSARLVYSVESSGPNPLSAATCKAANKNC